MNGKIQTSIQYQLTNNKIFEDVFAKWNVFSSWINQGPTKMKEFLFNEWYETKRLLTLNPNLIVKDFNRQVSIVEFDIKYIPTTTGIPVFYLIFPDYKEGDGASKIVGLALCEKRPRYFTLESAIRYENNSLTYVVGEFYVDYQTRSKKHNNYGFVDLNVDLKQFSSFIEQILIRQDEK